MDLVHFKKSYFIQQSIGEIWHRPATVRAPCSKSPGRAISNIFMFETPYQHIGHAYGCKGVGADMCVLANQKRRCQIRTPHIAKIRLATHRISISQHELGVKLSKVKEVKPPNICDSSSRLHDGNVCIVEIKNLLAICNILPIPTRYDGCESIHSDSKILILFYCI